MNKVLKRAVSLLLVLLLVASCVWSALTVQAAHDVLFKDDFSSSSLSGWQSTSVGAVANGSYKISGTGMNLVSGKTSEAGLGIAADLSVTRYTDPATGAVAETGTASIVFHANAEKTEYYEYGLGVNKNGAAYLMVSLCRADGTSDMNRLQSENINGVPGGRIRENTVYALKVLITEDKLQFLINDKLFYETKPVLKSGLFGISAWNATATAHNFKLQQLGEKEVDSIQVLNAPAQVALGAELGISVQVNYAGIYGSEILSEDAPGLKITGYDNTLGQKTLTVSYGGKSGSFTTDILPAVGDKVLYDAGKFTNAAEWTCTPDSGLPAYNFQVKNNRLELVYPDHGSYGSALKSYAVANVDTAVTKGVYNYYIEAEMAITSEGKVARTPGADLYLANGYFFRVALGGAVSLYKSAAGVNTSIASGDVSGIDLGKKFKVRVEVCDNVWSLDVNDKRVLTVEADKQDVTPHARVQSTNGGMAVYNYKMAAFSKKTVWAAKSIKVLDADGNAVTKLVSRKLDVSSLVLRVTYVDGTVRYAPIKEDMLSGYDANSKKAQTVTVTYGNATTNFNYEYTSYLFFDDFNSGKYKAEWSGFTNPTRYSWSVEKGWLYAKNKTLGQSKKYGGSAISIASPSGVKAKDVAVSADFKFANTYFKSNLEKEKAYMGLQARKSGGKMYEYRMLNDANVVSLELLRHGSDGAKTLHTVKQGDIVRLLEIESLDREAVFNLRMEIIGNNIYLFVNDKLMHIYSDSDEEAITAAGTVAVKVINCDAMIDNVCVEPMEPRDIVDISITGQNENGEIDLVRGMALDTANMTVVARYSDGFVSEDPMMAEYLSQDRGFPVGRSEVTLTYRGYKSTFTVNVYERPEYVQAFVDKMKGINPAGLTAADEAKVAEICAYFDTLSPWEVQNLDAAVYKTYRDMVEAMDRLRIAETKDKALLYYDDFSSETLDTGVWDIEYESIVGEWDQRNGYITNEQMVHNESGNGLALLKNLYGEINVVEVDLMMVYPACYTAVAFNVTDKGYYHARVTNKVYDTEGNVMYTVQLLKYSSSRHTIIGQVYAQTKGIAVKEGEFNTMRIVSDNGKISIYIDGTPVLAYSDSGEVFYEGSVALRVSEADGRYDNLRIYGTAKERPKDLEYEKQITPVEYTDDFEDEAIGKDPSHWSENKTDDWKVYNKGGSKVYGTGVTDRPTYTFLHSYECDPVIKSKMMYTGSGKAGFIARFYDDISYMAIGYDTATKKWFVADTQSSEQDELQVIYAETATPMTAGQWYEVEIQLSGKSLTVKVGGNTVLEVKDRLLVTDFGRMGYFASGAQMYGDDLYVKNVNGCHFEDADQLYTTNIVTTHSEIEEIRPGVLVAGDDDYISYNNGASFEKTSDYQGIQSVSPGYTSILNVKGDTWIQLADGENGDMVVQQSDDDMRNWRTISTLLPASERKDAYGNSIAIFHVGTLTQLDINGKSRIFAPIGFRKMTVKGVLNGHYTRIFYSDDNGYTWIESENDTRDLLPGYDDNTYSSICESKIIKCADGSIRCYESRHGGGCIGYFESKDGGVTWSEFGLVPYLQCGVVSYGIDEDPSNPGTYYMAWVNSLPDKIGGGMPRVRISLVRTTDGKNWEFLCDIERTTNYRNAQHTYVRQFLDPNVTVTENTVHVTFGRSTIGKAGDTHNNQTVRYYSIAKDALTVKPWDDATMEDSCFPKSIAMGTLPQTKFGYADLFNTLGATVIETSVNGLTKENDIRNYTILNGGPNMFKLGKQTITLMSENYLLTSYEIEIVPNYDLVWTIKGKGTVDPDPDATLRMMEGSSQTFTLKPAKGYKVSYVKVNGEKVKVKKNTFTLSDVRETKEITVSFVKRSIMDYLPWIILGVVVVAGIGVGCVLLIPRLKKKKAAKEEDIDISSTSTPPTDEN